MALSSCVYRWAHVIGDDVSKMQAAVGECYSWSSHGGDATSHKPSSTAQAPKATPPRSSPTHLAGGETRVQQLRAGGPSRSPAAPTKDPSTATGSSPMHRSHRAPGAGNYTNAAGPRAAVVPLIDDDEYNF